MLLFCWACVAALAHMLSLQNACQSLHAHASAREVVTPVLRAARASRSLTAMVRGLRTRTSPCQMRRTRPWARCVKLRPQNHSPNKRTPVFVLMLGTCAQGYCASLLDTCTGLSATLHLCSQCGAQTLPLLDHQLCAVQFAGGHAAMGTRQVVNLRRHDTVTLIRCAGADAGGDGRGG